MTEEEEGEWEFFDWSLPDKESKTPKEKVKKVCDILASVKRKWKELVNEMALFEGHLTELKNMIEKENSK